MPLDTAPLALAALFATAVSVTLHAVLADAFSPGLPRRSVRYLLLGVVGGAALSLTGLAGIAYGLPLSASTVTALGITGAVGLPLSAHAATVLDDA